MIGYELLHTCFQRSPIVSIRRQCSAPFDDATGGKGIFRGKETNGKRKHKIIHTDCTIASAVAAADSFLIHCPQSTTSKAKLAGTGMESNASNEKELQKEKLFVIFEGFEPLTRPWAVLEYWTVA